ncbi:MAG TPA: hypothetical protein VNA57_10090 [Acidimicrobiales bacterium]|nr:hypothetical protein [Acidimicrobiales bacterium]
MAHAMAQQGGSPDPLLHFAGQTADTFLESVADGRGGVLLYIAPAADGWDVGIRDLEGYAPADVLLGFVAPDEWLALGIAAGGWAHDLDAAPSVATRRQRVAAVTIVLRSGAVVARRGMGEEVLREPPAYGLSLDGLQRALDLPAAPPLHSTGVLFATNWLDHIVVAAGDRGRRLTWPEARILHPALQLLAQEFPDVEGVDVVAAARVLERACGWDELRWMVVDGRRPDDMLTPTDAAWLDAGSFSRWTMSWRADVDTLLDQVRRASGSSVARRCAAVLHHLQVPCRGRGAA